MHRWLLALPFLLSLGVAQAADTPQATKFAALRSVRINMHTGPGLQYPIAWVYQRKLLPVEVLAEYDKWKKVVDPDGASGWIQETMLTDKRTFLVQGSDVKALRHDPDSNSPVVASLQPGVVGKLTACQRDWCHAKVDDYQGWLAKTDFWGAMPGEVFEK